MKTKADLEKEVVELWNKNNALLGRLNKEQDRKKLAGLYLQCIRLLPDYSDNDELYMCSRDFGRVLSILEQNDFPEGF